MAFSRSNVLGIAAVLFIDLSLFAAAFAPAHNRGFTLTPICVRHAEHGSCVVLKVNSNDDSGADAMDHPMLNLSRKQWLASASASLLTMAVGARSAFADGDEAAGVKPSLPTFSITKCSSASKAPCVSTSNVRQLDLYLPPWTYDPSQHSAVDVMSRLKGAIVSVDPSSSVTQQDGDCHLIVESKRSNDLLGTSDTLEFVINDVDHVITFKSLASNENPDFGASRRRLEEIRQRASIFGVMGSNLSSADSVSDGQRGYGPLGQLKAFYGLQSGAGYEDVVLDR